jgi:hypothetical protein
VASTECRAFRICFCVIVIFISESIVLCKDRFQWIFTIFCEIVMFIF